MDVWLTANEAADLLGISERAVRKNCKNKKYRTQLVGSDKGGGNGGKQYHIALSSIPPEAQAEYWGKHGADGRRRANPGDNQEDNQGEPPPFEDKGTETLILSSAPEWRRQQAESYLAVMESSAGLTGKDLKEFVTKWNRSLRGNKQGVKVSYRNLMHKRSQYKTQGITALLPDWGKNGGSTAIQKAWYEYFEKAYLREQGPGLRSAWLETFGWAKKQTTNTLRQEDFPSPWSFYRRLLREIPRESIYLARYGYEAYNRKYGNYVERDFSGVKVGEVWVSDHAQVDVGFLLKHKNKIVFPWVSAWRDFKSGKWLGWLLHWQPPNSDHVFQSLEIAIEKWGIPTDIIIDNGKDYRCYDFAGGRPKTHKLQVDENKARGLTATLKIKPHFAIPRNAQAKPIERDFLKNKEWFSRRMPGYRGGNVTEKPEKLKTEISSGAILEYGKIDELFNLFIEKVLNEMPSNGKVQKGRSANQVWQQEFEGLEHLSAEALKLMFMRVGKPITVGRNGVKDPDFGVTYWGEWMSGMKGEKVILRRNPKQYETAWCFHAKDDRYLGQARMAVFDAPALARTEVEKQQLRDALAAKKRAQKIAREYAKVEQIDPEEAIYNLSMGVEAVQDNISNRQEACEPNKQGEPVRHYRLTDMDEVARREKKEKFDWGKYIAHLEEEKVREEKNKLYVWEWEKRKAEGQN